MEKLILKFEVNFSLLLVCKSKIKSVLINHHFVSVFLFTDRLPLILCLAIRFGVFDLIGFITWWLRIILAGTAFIFIFLITNWKLLRATCVLFLIAWSRWVIHFGSGSFDFEEFAWLGLFGTGVTLLFFGLWGTVGLVFWWLILLWFLESDRLAVYMLFGLNLILIFFLSFLRFWIFLPATSFCIIPPRHLLNFLSLLLHFLQIIVVRVVILILLFLRELVPFHWN